MKKYLKSAPFKTLADNTARTAKCQKDQKLGQ